MLNSNGESGHHCLVPDFRGNAFNFSPLRIMFAVDLTLFNMFSFYNSLEGSKLTEIIPWEKNCGAVRIPGTEGPGRLPSTGSQRVEHN